MSNEFQSFFFPIYSANTDDFSTTHYYYDSEPTSRNPVHRARYPETNNHLEEEAGPTASERTSNW